MTSAALAATGNSTGAPATREYGDIILAAFHEAPVLVVVGTLAAIVIIFVGPAWVKGRWRYRTEMDRQRLRFDQKRQGK